MTNVMEQSKRVRKPEGLLTVFVQDILFFYRIYEVVENTIFVKNAIFPVKKNFGLFFLLISILTNLKEKFKRVHPLL